MNFGFERTTRIMATSSVRLSLATHFVFSALFACFHSTATAGEYQAVNRIDSDPLVESVGNTRNMFSGTYTQGNPADPPPTSYWQQIPTLVRNLPVGGTLKEARFLVAGVGGYFAPDASMPFLQISDFERFNFSFQMWTEGDERPGNSFFADPRQGDVTVSLPAPTAPGLSDFSFVRLPDTIPGFPLWEATINLAPYNIEVEQGQEFAFTLYGERNGVDGYFAIRHLSYLGPHDLLSSGFTGNESPNSVGYFRNSPSGPATQLATALTLEIEGPDVIPTATTRAIYTGASGGQFGLASNWDKGVVPINNETKYNAVIPDDKGVINFVVTSDVEITHLSTGFGNTLNISGGHQLTVAEEAVVPGIVNVDGSGTTVSFSERTSIEQLGRLNVTGGAQVTATLAEYRFPKLATRQHPDPPPNTSQITPFRVSGAGSLLDLSELREIRGILGTPSLIGTGSHHTIAALDGGVLDLSKLETIDVHKGGIDQCTVTIDASTGTVLLDNLATAQMHGAILHGIIMKFGAGDVSLPSLVTAPLVSLQKQGAGVLDVPLLKDFSFSELRLSGAGAQFNAPSIDVIHGSSYIMRDGAHFALPPNPATTDGSWSYVAQFPRGNLGLYSPYKPPALISAGSQTTLDLNRLVGFDVTLGSGGGISSPGEISAIEGGTIQLDGLESLAALTGLSPVYVNVESGGRIELGAPSIGGPIKFHIDGAASTLVAASLALSQDNEHGNFPIRDNALALRNGSSLLLNNRALLQIRDELTFTHQLGNVASATLERVRNETSPDIFGLSFVNGGIDLNRGVVQFVGPGIGSLEVAGPSFTGFGPDGRPITPEDRAEFGIAQLVIGAPGEAKAVELVDNIFNANRIGTQRESLYLWGFDEGLPAYVGGPLGDGQGAALVLHAGSILRIPETIDVVVYDSAASQFVHLNPLLNGSNQISFGDGFLELFDPEVNIPGDYNGDDIVDGSDYATWRESFGSTTDLTADGNDDNIVNAADYVLWRDRLGAMASGAENHAAVPEPSGICLTAIAILLMASASGRAYSEKCSWIRKNSARRAFLAQAEFLRIQLRLQTAKLLLLKQQD